MPNVSESVQSSVASLWRYPVKSMMGEELSTAEISERGILGDRAYALVDTQNKVGTGKKIANLLNFQARFLDQPRAGEAIPAVRITLPNGTTITSEQAAIGGILSAALGRNVTLVAAAPQGLTLEFPAGTLSGKHAATTEAPIAGAAPAGTFFDYAVVHVLTTSTLQRLRDLYPQGRIEIRRFRPNIVVETGDSGFVENSWVGRTLALGNEVLLRVTIPCPRCVMTTLPQADLPQDPGILRAAAQHNRLDLGEFGELPCLGVYADVLKPGLIQRGDPVRLD